MISKLIVADPKQRISLRELKKHAFFKGLDWDAVEKGKVKPPTPQLREIRVSNIPMSAYDSDYDEDEGSNLSELQEEAKRNQHKDDGFEFTEHNFDEQNQNNKVQEGINTKEGSSMQSS